MLYIEYNFYGGLPTLGQRWQNGQRAVGPKSAANVGPTDVLTLGQRWSDGVSVGVHVHGCGMRLADAACL